MTEAIHHFFSPSGRIGQQAWWLSMIALLGLLFAVNFAGGFLTSMHYCAKSPSDADYVYCHWGTSPIASLVQSLSLAVGLWCTFAISTKRFHDLNHSAWCNLLIFIPIIGFFIWLLILGLAPGRVPNHYGD